VTEKNKDEKYYIIRFQCLNCGYDFSIPLPFGYDIEENIWAQSCKCGDYIVCSKCGSLKIRKVIKW